MLAKLEEGIALSLVELFEIEDVLIKGHRLLHVIHFDGDVIAPIDFYAHPSIVKTVANEASLSESAQMPQTDADRERNKRTD